MWCRRRRLRITVASTKVVCDGPGDERGARREGGHRVIFWKTSHSPSGERRDDRSEQYRPCPLPARAAGPGHPDLLRQMLTTFINTLMSAEADAVCGAGYGARSSRADQRPQRLPAPGVRHPRRHPGRGDPQAALRVLLPGLAAGAPPAGGAGADHRGRHLLPARRLHPADGAAGRVLGHHPAVEVPGQRDGQGPRRPGRGLPAPPAGRRARTRSSPPTPWCSRSARAAGWSTCTPWSRPA